ncbi:3-oxoacyl-(acyl-carrier-protein) synthase III [Rhodomicrobium vannielii ATCC 17100]|uniref:Beta-ketoacyl-[acyl-carrier-protein] synthase III n=1 Tax=Rhodomicrobium vannielii (strain ATCC 17100 / DSM 162 / LMG 4299 / NCIMB 10020 / ATH 3.1.1) TaxID=648757 RepID=E3I5W9_RHOVT|nr:beta-ketoacyl-ACP synthase III [Rhodomicrobium vannielii]ADP70562.1 3-oxoacyl-(acyl-carrier-protein) synthase III [Rhodomicrobium vannielii ATCC 17100]
MKQTRSVVLGCGSYLPERVLTNQDLARIVDTSDEWISDRSGIKTRHIAADGEMTSDLGIAAARAALDHAGIDPQSLDFIILATSTPDNTFPSTATTIQAGLGLTHGFAFDVQAVCSGFAYALATADNFIRAGQGKRGLVIGAETFSRILDWEDRGTCVLFGDGAGAVVLEATQVQDPMRERCIIGSMLFSDGRHKDKLYVDGGPSSTQTVGHLRMQGKEVFRFAVNAISDVVERTLAAHNLRPSDIDWFVPHQANKRILDGTAKKVGIAEEKIVITLDRHGNTSAASIPLALSTAVHDGRIKRGDLVLFEAMGGGFTWGANLVRW